MKHNLDHLTAGDFPRMIYNKEGGQKVVRTRGELQDALMEGWSTSPSGLSEAEIMELKIEQAEAELKDMKRRLSILKGEPVELGGGDGEDDNDEALLLTATAGRDLLVSLVVMARYCLLVGILHCVIIITQHT